MSKLYLNGYLDIPSHRWAEVMNALPKHIELTRQEAGCLLFEVVADEKIEGRLLVSEIFENREAFDTHQRCNVGTAWVKITEGIPRHYKITDQ